MRTRFETEFFMAKQGTNVRRAVGAALAALILSAGAWGVERADTRALLDAYPGLRVEEWQGRPAMFYGKPMNAAGDARIAAETWIRAHARAFGVGELSLNFNWENDLDHGRMTVFNFAQHMDGLPVEFGVVRVLVLNSPEGHTVVAANAKVAERPAGGFPAATLTAKQAVDSVRAVREYKTLPVWSDPEMIVYFGEGDLEQWITARRVWKFVGEQPIGAFARKFSFFVDAATGELIHARNEILNINVTGRVMAQATPTPMGNAAADHPGNPPSLQPVPNIRVRINGNNANSAITDDQGNFSIFWGGTAPVRVEASFGDGQWARVVDGVNPVQYVSANAVPGTPVTLTMNATPSAITNAQANAFIHQTSTHNFIKRYAPDWGPNSPTGELSIDVQFPANVQVQGECNAFYNGSSTNFFNASGTCNNTAYSTVVAHEYGHHIVNRLQLAQRAFGEGFSDGVSILQYDDFVIGRFFFLDGSPVRTPDTTNRQYPCNGCGSHDGGEILGGVICEIRKAYGQKYGQTPGLERTRQEFLNWGRFTAGGRGGNSAHPTTLAEWLTINDDDGNLDNGTPDLCEIISSFKAHGIEGPLTFAFLFPDGLPARPTLPGAPIVLRTDVFSRCITVVPNSGRFFWRYAGAATYNEVTMNQIVPDSYFAVLPGQQCGTSIQYHFRVNTNEGFKYWPSVNNGPGIATIFVAERFAEFTDDFERPTGWDLVDSTATAGFWARVEPIATAAAPGDDTSPHGTSCWVTQQSVEAGEPATANDVDGGFTTLNSPLYDFRNYDDVEVSYWRWYSNGVSGSRFQDRFRIEVSDNDGQSWRSGETVGPGSASDPNVNPGWRFAAWKLSARGLAPSDKIRVRFIAEDAGTESTVEAAIDDFAIRGFGCPLVPPCYADFNGDGGVDGADVEAFYLVWSTGESAADVNQDGGVDGGDIETFFIAWESGECPN